MSTVNLYACRDAMWLDQQGGHYVRHVDHMTREGLHSKSDIAAELGWRDYQIAELTRQVSALQLSHDNIINSLGIKGDGPWSKLVIEYVMGLVAERDGLAEKLALAENIAISSANDIAYAIFNLSNKNLSQLKNGIIESTCPTDSALIAERNLRDFAANLCAGRKG